MEEKVFAPSIVKGNAVADYFDALDREDEDDDDSDLQFSETEEGEVEGVETEGVEELVTSIVEDDTKKALMF